MRMTDDQAVQAIANAIHAIDDLVYPKDPLEIFVREEEDLTELELEGGEFNSGFSFVKRMHIPPDIRWKSAYFIRRKDSAQSFETIRSGLKFYNRPNLFTMNAEEALMGLGAHQVRLRWQYTHRPVDIFLPGTFRVPWIPDEFFTRIAENPLLNMGYAFQQFRFDAIVVEQIINILMVRNVCDDEVIRRVVTSGPATIQEVFQYIKESYPGQ